jgi:hypothetical protein
MATNFEIHTKKTNKSSDEENQQSLFLFDGNPVCLKRGLRSGLVVRLNGQKRASPTHMMDHAILCMTIHPLKERGGGSHHLFN